MSWWQLLILVEPEGKSRGNLKNRRVRRYKLFSWPIE
jgi:hypothetical protein